MTFPFPVMHRPTQFLTQTFQGCTNGPPMGTGMEVPSPKQSWQERIIITSNHEGLKA